MKKYGITELSRLFGISSEAIRKYEAKGVIHAMRNDQNSFREYETWDISTLLHARKYTQMGFSVSLAADLLNGADLEKTLDEINTRKRELADEILYRQKLMKTLQAWEKELREYRDIGNAQRVEHRPSIVFCQLYNDSDLVNNQQLIDQAKPAISDYIKGTAMC